jgi:acylphosphatase
MSTHVSHREVWYTGRVQGVGFRAQALSVARSYDVTGFVQNLADGRVYVHVEGSGQEVDAYTEQLAKTMDGYIRTAESRDFAGVRTSTDFSIRR